MKKSIFSTALVLGLGVSSVAGYTAEANTIDEGHLADLAQNNSNELNNAAIHTGAYNYSFDVDNVSYNFESNGTEYNWSYGNYTQEQSVEQTAAPVEQTAAPVEQEAAPVQEETTSAPAPEESVEAPQAPAAATNTGDAASTAHSVASGKSYVYGGNSATAVDCSALTQQFMKQHKGIDIPRTAAAQQAAGTQVSDPQPGDLVFFNGGTHVGIYIGNGQMVDALNPSEHVGERSVNYVSGSVDGYYRY